MNPTVKLRFVTRVGYSQASTILQQWWEYSESEQYAMPLNEIKQGEWRDVPLEEEERRK